MDETNRILLIRCQKITRKYVWIMIAVYRVHFGKIFFRSILGLKPFWKIKEKKHFYKLFLHWLLVEAGQRTLNELVAVDIAFGPIVELNIINLIRKRIWPEFAINYCASSWCHQHVLKPWPLAISVTSSFTILYVQIFVQYRYCICDPRVHDTVPTNGSPLIQ